MLSKNYKKKLSWYENKTIFFSVIEEQKMVISKKTRKTISENKFIESEDINNLPGHKLKQLN